MMEAAREIRTAGDERERLRRGAAEGGVAADVTGEGRCVEGLPLEGQPVFAQHPAHGALIRGDGGRGLVAGMLTGPGFDGNHADEVRAGLVGVRRDIPDLLMLPADAGACQRDDLGDIRLQRDAIRAVGRALRIGGLSIAAKPADHGNRTRTGVVALQRPSGAGGIVRGAGDGEVGFDVPFQLAERRPGAADLLHERRIVRKFVREHVPVAGRRLGVRSISPILREHAVKIAARHIVRRVGAARDGIDRETGAVVRAEGAVAHRAGRGVDDGGIIQQRAFAQHIHGVLFVLRITRAGREEGARA